MSMLGRRFFKNIPVVLQLTFNGIDRISYPVIVGFICHNSDAPVNDRLPTRTSGSLE